VKKYDPNKVRISIGGTPISGFDITKSADLAGPDITLVHKELGVLVHDKSWLQIECINCGKLWERKSFGTKVQASVKVCGNCSDDMQWPDDFFDGEGGE